MAGRRQHTVQGRKSHELGGRLPRPTLIRWPGVIKPNTIHNEAFSHCDLIATFCAAAGEPDIVAKCMTGYDAGAKIFKVHLDGYNMLAFLSGSDKESPRRDFLYWNDDGDLVAVRVQNWKVVFKAQENQGIGVWRRPFSDLRVPMLFNLRADPFERGSEPIEYDSGCSTERSSWCHHRLSLRNGWRASRSFQLGRSQPASTLMTLCRSSPILRRTKSETRQM